MSFSCSRDNVSLSKVKKLFFLTNLCSATFHSRTDVQAYDKNHLFLILHLSTDNTSDVMKTSAKNIARINNRPVTQFNRRPQFCSSTCMLQFRTPCIYSTVAEMVVGTSTIVEQRASITGHIFAVQANLKSANAIEKQQAFSFRTPCMMQLHQFKLQCVNILTLILSTESSAA